MAETDPAAPGRLAFVFPGVGAALGSHEPAFFGRHETLMRPRLEAAGALAGIDFVEALRTGVVPPHPELAGQLFGYAVSVALADVLRSGGVEPAVTAGHSLGLYAALQVAGAIGFEDGLRITADAYDCAERACPSGSHGLAAIVGFPQAELEQLLRQQADPSLRIVNVNNPTSLLVAGPRAPLEAFAAIALAQGALKAPLLDAKLPYHHPALLAGASACLEPRLRRLSWSEPRCPVISSIDGSVLDRVEALVTLTSRNVATPIDWHRVVEAMAQLGLELAIECGVGTLLTQNSRLSGCGPRFLGLRLWADRWAL